MIECAEIEAYFKIDDVHFAKASGDGYHYELIVVSDVFAAMSKIQRQQWVYHKLHTHIQDGSIHALTMKTWTVKEWEQRHG